MRWLFVAFFASALLASCGKPASQPSSSDRCADAKGAPGLETDAQAQQSCRNNKKFLGPDAKSSNTKIENN